MERTLDRKVKPATDPLKKLLTTLEVAERVIQYHRGYPTMSSSSLPCNQWLESDNYALALIQGAIEDAQKELKRKD